MRRGPGRRSVALLVAAVLALVIAACGSSSSSSSGSAGSAGAQSLLNATFSGSHAVKSGVLGFNLTLTPSGSSTIKGPISLGLNGPFQSRGSGQLPSPIWPSRSTRSVITASSGSSPRGPPAT